MDKFENCISLGWFCGTASSMSRYGLRSHSGPFDWFFSDFDSVLKVIETDFSDFMKKENLVPDKKNNKIFYDTKYRFSCNHDIESDFDHEYQFIFERYMRRAERFMQSVRRPTCFIRTVRSEREIQFIEENGEYIYKVIKKENCNNEIIYLLLKNMKRLSDEYLWFRLGLEDYSGQTYEMRHMFDSSNDFSVYCKNKILAGEDIRCNTLFDKAHIEPGYKVSVLMRKLDADKCNIGDIFKEYYPDIDRGGVFLWGMGTYGVLVLKYFHKNKIRVNGIIDNDPEKWESFCEGIPVMPFSQIKGDSINIFVAVSSASSSEEITNQIINKYPKALIWGLTDLINHPQVSQLMEDI